MGQITPDIPGPLDPAGRGVWAQQMNAALAEIVDQGNASDAAVGDLRNAVAGLGSSSGGGTDFTTTTDASGYTVVKAGTGGVGYLRGINVAGGDFGTQPSQLSNPASLYGSVWQYDSQATFDYLASRGITLIRLPVLWEHLQTSLGAALDPTMLGFLTDAIARIGSAGMQAIIDVHNYGAYATAASGYLPQKIGQGVVTDAHFIDLWTRLSTVFKNNPTIYGYGLMNEPSNCYSTSLTARQRWDAWQNVTQQVLSGIRANGDTKRVFIMKMNIDGETHDWTVQNPTQWIVDPANNFSFEWHSYADIDRSGTYKDTYAATLADAQAAGYSTVQERIRAYIRPFLDWCVTNHVAAFCGEFGVPTNDADAANWAAVAEDWYDYLDGYGFGMTWWSVGELFSQYKLAPYVQPSRGQPISVMRNPAAGTLEAHPSVTASGAAATVISPTQVDAKITAVAPHAGIDASGNPYLDLGQGIVDGYYYTDFSEYAAGAAPADWTQPWAASSVWTAYDAAGVGRVLRYTSTSSGRRALVWGKVPAAADVEVLFRWRPVGTYSSVVGVGRVTGAAGTESGYGGGLLNSTSAQVFSYVAGGARTDLVGHTQTGTADTWYRTRFRIRGTTLQERTWVDGTTEPTGWDISTTDSALSGAGAAGLYTNGNGTFDVDWFAAATGGNTATQAARRISYAAPGGAPVKNNYTAVGDPAVTDDSSGGYSVGSQWINTASRAAYECLSAGVGAAVWRRLTADVQAYTTPGTATWTKPAWAQTVQVALVSGGGAGASGRRGASGTASSGGGGGSGGGYAAQLFDASLLGSTETVTVGAGGTGGAAVTVDSTNGNQGTTAGASSFGTRLAAFSGARGPAGLSAAGTTGASGGVGQSTGGAGGGSNSGAAGSAGGSAGAGGSGGGGGGGITATPAFTAGGSAGGNPTLNTTTAGGATDGAAGGAGGSVTTGTAWGGAGGGGGASSVVGAGGAGGAGGTYGAGGGGGGASLNGFASGAGGNGGNGIVVVITR